MRVTPTGAGADFDGERLLADAQRICEAQIAFWHGALVNSKPEYEDCCLLARRAGVPLKRAFSFVATFFIPVWLPPLSPMRISLVEPPPGEVADWSEVVAAAPGRP